MNKPRIEYLNTGDAVEIIGESGSWLKCKALGKTGYIKTEYVSGEPTAPTNDQLANTDDLDDQDDQIPAQNGQDDQNEELGVWITSPNGGKVNIRAGNGPSYGRITSVPSNTVLPYVATASNGWYAVKVKNAVGWVSPEFASLGVG